MAIIDPIVTGLNSGWLHTDASQLQENQQFEADVVIVGTGAGGGVAAEILTQAGLSVIMIEAGPLKSSSDFNMEERVAYPNLYQQAAAMKTADKASGIAWVFVFTAVLGASIGPLLNRCAAMPNGSELIMQAFGATALIFFSLSAYTLTSKKDFSFMGNFLFVGLIMALVAGLANIFFQVPALQLAISAVIVLLMSGFILYDTGRIIQGGETNYIRATVSLYLNIFNLFTSLLSLLGFMNSDD